MRISLIACVTVLLLVIAPRYDIMAATGDSRSLQSSTDTPRHGDFILEGRCPKIDADDSAEVIGLEGIYRVMTSDLKSDGERYLQFAFQPPHKRSNNAVETRKKYRVINGATFDAGLIPSQEGVHKAMFLSLTNGFLGVVAIPSGECRFEIVTKAQDHLLFAELRLNAHVAMKWDEYEDLVRVGDSWIQRHEDRLYIKYGTTARELVAFFNRDEVWKPFTMMRRQVLLAHLSTEDVTRNANERYMNGLGAIRKKDYTNALREFDHVVHLKPALANAYLARGSAHFESQHYAEALRDFEDAIDLAPEIRDAWLKAGDAAIRTGDSESAFYFLRRATFLEPRDGKPQHVFFTLSVLTGNRSSEGSLMCGRAAELNSKYKPCLEVLFKKRREEQARLGQDQQDFLSSIIGLAGAAILAGVLFGSSDGADGSSASDIPRPHTPHGRVCTRKCYPAAGTANGQYCVDDCAYY